MDVHSKERRRYNMRRIRSKDTRPELIVRRFLFSKGLRFRLHDKRLAGKPDLVFPKYKVVIFVNGCFWHGHANCKYYSVPKTRTSWWVNKINRNKILDELNHQKLSNLGWRIIDVFECELNPSVRESTFDNLVSKIKLGNSNH